VYEFFLPADSDCARLEERKGFLTCGLRSGTAACLSECLARMPAWVQAKWQVFIELEMPRDKKSDRRIKQAYVNRGSVITNFDLWMKGATAHIVIELYFTSHLQAHAECPKDSSCIKAVAHHKKATIGHTSSLGPSCPSTTTYATWIMSSFLCDDIISSCTLVDIILHCHLKMVNYPVIQSYIPLSARISLRP